MTRKKRIVESLKALKAIDGVSVTRSKKNRTIHVKHKTQHSLHFRFTWFKDHYVGRIISIEGEIGNAVISIYKPIDAIHFATSYTLLMGMRAYK